MSLTETNLENDVGEDDLEGVEQVDQEPDLHRLDTGRAGQAGGHREVDGGQDHHAGDVDGVDHVVLSVTGDVVRGLVDEVHEDGGEVGYEGNAGESPGEGEADLHLVLASLLEPDHSHRMTRIGLIGFVEGMKPTFLIICARILPYLIQWPESTSLSRTDRVSQGLGQRSAGD